MVVSAGPTHKCVLMRIVRKRSLSPQGKTGLPVGKSVELEPNGDTDDLSGDNRNKACGSIVCPELIITATPFEQRGVLIGCCSKKPLTNTTSLLCRGEL